MLSLDFTRFGRRIALVTGAVAVASAVACSDDATAPRSSASALPQGAQRSIASGNSLVVVKIRDIWGSILTEKTTVKFSSKNGSLVLPDNAAQDMVNATDIIGALLPVADTFTVCLMTDTKNYGIDVTKPYCNSVPGNVGTVLAGSLVMRHFPTVGAYMQDMNGNSITGGSVKFVAPPNDGFSATVMDGGGNDLSQAVDGKIVINGNRPGTYTWCETAPPTGYSLTSPTCGTVNLYWDLGTGFIIKHGPLSRI